MSDSLHTLDDIFEVLFPPSKDFYVQVFEIHEDGSLFDEPSHTSYMDAPTLRRNFMSAYLFLKYTPFENTVAFWYQSPVDSSYVKVMITDLSGM